MNHLKNALEEMYLNGISPDDYKKPTDPEYFKRMDEYREFEDKFLASLGEEQKKEYFELLESIHSVSRLEIIESFSTGYFLSAQIILEVMVKMNNSKLVEMRHIAKRFLRNELDESSALIIR